MQVDDVSQVRTMCYYLLFDSFAYFQSISFTIKSSDYIPESMRLRRLSKIYSTAISKRFNFIKKIWKNLHGHTQRCCACTTCVFFQIN